MQKKEIQALAEKFLKDNPTEGVVFATTDGQLFTNVNAAKLHATTNPKKKKLTVLTFEANGADTDSGKKASTENDRPTAKELIAQVATLKDKEKLDALEKAENDHDEPARKTVIAAIGKRRAELADDGGTETDKNRKKDDPETEENKDEPKNDK